MNHAAGKPRLLGAKFGDSGQHHVEGRLELRNVRILSRCLHQIADRRSIEFIRIVGHSDQRPVFVQAPGRLAGSYQREGKGVAGGNVIGVQLQRLVRLFDLFFKAPFLIVNPTQLAMRQGLLFVWDVRHISDGFVIPDCAFGIA